MISSCHEFTWADDLNWFNALDLELWSKHIAAVEENQQSVNELEQQLHFNYHL